MSTEIKAKARDRILTAAAKVFAEHGVKGATTREIAKVAEVNETTLFRNFQTKELLLAAVVEKSASEISEALSGPGMSNNDLRKDLMYYAVIYNQVLNKNEPMVRMFIGEAHRQKEQACLIAVKAWQPVKEKLIAYMNAAKEQGKVRKNLDSELAVDILKGMILAHLFRRGMSPVPYSTDDYLETVLDIFVQGVAPLAGES